MSLAEARKLLDAENKAKEILARASGKNIKKTSEAKSHLKLVVSNKSKHKNSDEDDTDRIVKKISKDIREEADRRVRAKEKVKSVSDRKYMDEHKHANLLRPTLESMFDKVLTRKNLKVQKKVAALSTQVDLRPDFYIPEKKMFVVVFTIWTLYEESKSAWKLNRRVAEQVAEAEIKVKWAVVDHFHNKTSYFVLPKTWYEMEFKELQYYCRHAKWKPGVNDDDE